MRDDYPNLLLERIASHCTEYEPISAAQGYGYSWLNHADAEEEPRCDWCVYWTSGDCAIFTSRAGSSLS